MDGSIKRLGTNTILVFIGNMGSKLISLIMLPLYTRWLSVEEYRLTDIISVYVSLLFGIITCCITDALFVFPKDSSCDDKKKYFSSGVIFELVMLIVTLLCFILISWLSNNHSFNNSFTNNIWAIFFMLFSQTIQQTSQQFVRSIDKMKVYSISGIVSTVAVALYSFILIPKHGVMGYVWAIILSNVTAAVYSLFASGSLRFFSVFSMDTGYLNKMLKYSIPLIPNGVMWWLVNAINRPIMEKSIGLYGNGVYAVANKFPGVLTMLFAVFITAWQISVLEEFKKDNYSVFYNRVFKLVFYALVFFMLLITIFSKSIITIFADPDFYEAWKYVPALTLSVVFSSVAGFVGVNFSASRESKYYFYSSIFAALVAVVLNSLLIPRFGIWGAVLSVNGSFVVMAISRIFFSSKYVQIRNKAQFILLVLFAVLFCYIYAKEYPIIINISLLIAFCFYVLITERRLLLSVINKYKHDK